jgi:hypothetical protein
MGVLKNNNCKLLNIKTGVCPLKPQWISDCPESFSCDVKRKYRKYRNEVKQNAIL